VWAMPVVVINEDAKDMLKMLGVQEQEPVETLRANRPDKPLRHSVRLRGAKRRANDLQPVTLEHSIDTVGEFLIPVANQESEGFRPVSQGPRQLARLLRDARPAWMGRAPSQMHATTAQLDEEEHVEPLQPGRLHREEIDRQHALPMRSYELAPGDAWASADRPEATCPQPGAHGGRRYRNAKPLELTDDALVSPPRVLSRQTQDQLPDLLANRRPTNGT
jgi:hypothetical protein